jgi:hypothetical protein
VHITYFFVILLCLIFSFCLYYRWLSSPLLTALIVCKQNNFLRG